MAARRSQARVHIRPMTTPDLKQVVAVEAACFGAEAKLGDVALNVK
jgi:hypothetical protein